MMQESTGGVAWLESRVAARVMLVLAAVFFLLRFAHLAADYPTGVRWEDGILTDEGWYSAAVVNLHAWGLPLLSGDMNTAVLLPVWPLLAYVASLLFGLHVEVLRGLSVVLTLAAAGMLAVVLRGFGSGRWVPLLLVLVAVNPWAFVISRGAFLEAPMLVFFLGALLMVLRRPSWAGDVGAGLLFGVALLTKSSALPMAPVLAFAVLQRDGYRWRRALRDNIVLFATAGMVAGLFWATVSRHFATDALFYTSTIPVHVGHGVRAVAAQVSRPFRYAAGSDRLLFLFSVVLLLATAVVGRLRGMWRDPLFALAGVWAGTVLLALVALNNVMVHYLALLLPALVLLAVAVLRMPIVPLWWKTMFAVLLCVDAGVNAVQVTGIVLRPQYSFQEAARGVEAAMRRDAGANRVVLGDNAAEVALQADIAPVNLFAHSASVTRQVDRFQPDWWLQYTPEDDGSCFQVVLARGYSAEPRGSWEISQGRRLTLYRLRRLPGTVLPHALNAAEEAACRSPYVAGQREFAEVPVDVRFAR